MRTSQQLPDRIELWVQPLPGDEFGPVVERLRRIQRRAGDGNPTEVAVRTWDRYVDRSDPSADLCCRRLAEIERWVDASSSLAEGGVPTTVGIGRMGVETTLYRVPRAALVEYANGRPVSITVAGEGEGRLHDRLATIEAALERAESDEEVEPERPAGLARSRPAGRWQRGRSRVTRRGDPRRVQHDRLRINSA